MNSAAFFTYIIKIPSIKLVSITLYTYKNESPRHGTSPCDITGLANDAGEWNTFKIINYFTEI